MSDSRIVAEALGHLPHIGAVRAARLATAGSAAWPELLAAADPLCLGTARWTAVRTAAATSLAALRADDTLTLARLLRARDHWRLLSRWFDEASFFDIETSGLECGSEVTVVTCLHAGRLYHFVRGENLDDFLPLLEEMRLLVSFNGAGFDVPRILDLYHIPALPCAHVDLRWMCHHAGWQGGLKYVEARHGVRRPADLEGVDGAAAVWLWRAWQEERADSARQQLVRYCAADSVALKLLAARLLADLGHPPEPPPAAATLWGLLDEECPAAALDFQRSTLNAQRPTRQVPHPAWPGSGDLSGMLRDLAGGDRAARAERQRRLRQRWRELRRCGGV